MPKYLLHDFVHDNSPHMRLVMEELIRVASMCANTIGLDKNTVRVNALALAAALKRYTRDAFGFQRVVHFMEARFAALAMTTHDANKNEIIRLKDDLLETIKESGIRIPSGDPYAYKRCAFLLYHLTVLRPFYIAGARDDDPEGEKKAYFNAGVSLYIVKLALATIGYTFPTNKTTIDLLRDLTFRTLSRSAMEAMMRTAIRPVPGRTK